MDTERGEPARAWEAFDCRCAPHTRQDKGPTRRAIHHLSRADAQHGMSAGLDEEGELGVGTQAPIGHGHILRWSGRVDRLDLGEIVREERRDDQLQEHTGARMDQP
jgi:hypothetical protein